MVVASGRKLLDVAAATGLPPLSPKLPFNTFGGPKNFKFSFVRSKFYAKAAAFVVPSGAAVANMDLDLGVPSKTATPMLSAVPFALNSAVESRLASLESHLSKLSVLIKSLVESISALIVLVTELLSTPSAMNVLVKKCVDELAKQNKGLVAVITMMQKRITHFEKICERVCLENRLDVNDMVDNIDNNNDNDKEFSPFRIKSSTDQTAKWISGMVKNSYKLVSIMGKMYELDMFDTLVAIGDEIFLTTLKIVWSSGVAFVSFFFLLVALHDVLLDIFSYNIKFALGIFGVVTSQYAVVHFKDTSFTAAALIHWSVLVKKNSIRILPVVNQNDVISLRDTFKTKLVNFSFCCTAFEISDLVFQVGGHTCFIPRFSESYQCQCFAVVIFNFLKSLNAAVSKTDLTYLAVDYKKSSPLPPKLSSNIFGGPRDFKSLFAESKSYAKAAALVVPFVAAAVEINLNLGSSPKTTTPMLSIVSSAPNIAVASRLVSLKSHLSKLFVLIKFLVEPVSALVVLVTKLLSTPPAIDVSVKKNITGLAKQNKDLAAKKCERACLEDMSKKDKNMDDYNDDNKVFLVYNNTFDVMMYLWEDQFFRIKSSPDYTAK
ncbi:hypothetical protein G9A89_012790 [Geosiphon pyriformis]|nr:hypothetical protein G9A89_012790 [Geosiphon pyriformis]